MKLKFIILLIAVLLISVATASAYDLEVTDINYEYDYQDPATGVESIITVTVQNSGTSDYTTAGTAELEVDFGDTNTATASISQVSMGDTTQLSFNHAYAATTPSIISISGEIINNPTSAGEEDPTNEYLEEDFSFDPLFAFDISDVEIDVYRDDVSSATTTVSNEGNLNVNAVSVDIIADAQGTTTTSSIANTSFSTTPQTIQSLTTSTQTVDIDATINATQEIDTYEGTVVLEYYDGSNQPQTVESVLTVNVLNHVPVFNSISNQLQIIGNEFIYTVSATDDDIMDTIEYSLVSGPSNMVIDSNTGEISGWTPTSATTQTVTVSATDTYDTVEETFTVTPVPDAPNINIVESEIEFGDSNQDRGVTLSQLISIENAGTQDLTSLTATLDNGYGSSMGSQYSASVTGLPSNLAVGDSTTATITITVPADASAKREQFGRVLISATSTTNQVEVQDNVDLSLQAKSYLEITNVDVYVNDDKDSGSTIDVKEGDTIKIEVNVENTYSSSQDIDIEDTHILAEDNNWDIDEESDENEDIEADDDFDFEIEFTLDDELDDDTTTILLTAQGDDENENFLHYDEYEIDFEVDREDDEVVVSSVILLNDPIYNNEEFTDIDVTIRNSGEDDQSDAAIRLFSNELNIDMTKDDIEIDAGDTYDYRFTVALPENVEAGVYTLYVAGLVNEDDQTDVETVELEILDYGSSYGSENSESSDESESSVIVNGNTNEGTGGSGVPVNGISYAQTTSTRSKFFNSGWYVALLIVAALAIIGAIAFLVSTYLFPKREYEE